jgi:predicted phosphodiesterase
MLVAVISDTHMGAGGGADPFGHADEAFLRFLAHLEASFERIVLLGDIFETLQPAVPGRLTRELRRAREAHPAIAERFTRDKYQYVFGNHDFVAAREGAPAELHIEADGVRILFTHGHLHDWLIRRFRHLSEAGVWVGGWLKRLGLARLVELWSSWENEQRTKPVDELGSFQRWALGMAMAREADVIVTAHTHEGGCCRLGDKLYLNSGTCSGGAFSYVSIDTKQGEYALCQGW